MPFLSVSIPGFNNSSKLVNLNTDVQFAVEVGTGGVPKTCQTILEQARRDGKPAFLDLYKVRRLKEQFDSLRNQLNDSNLNANATIPNQDLQDYMDTVENSQLPVLRLVKSCLSEELKVDQKNLKEAQAAYETSKARFESIDEDHEYVGYYESWFPLHRHVKESNLFLLFGMSIFFLVLSILTFLNLTGIEFKFILPSFQSSEYGGGWDFGNARQYAIGGVVVGSIFVAIGLWRKWF